MKTSELIGPALDWAVAKCEGHEIESLRGGAVWYWLKCSLTGALEVVEVFNPSTDWAQGGPIIEREGLGVSQYNNIPDRPENRWQCVKYAGGMLLGNHRPICAYGPTPLIAAMRCYVASKLGDEVEIPEELKCNSSTHQP